MLTLKALTLFFIYLLNIPQAECLCKGLDVYNQVKKLNTDECVWSASDKYTQDLRFAHSSGEIRF